MRRAILRGQLALADTMLVACPSLVVRILAGTERLEVVARTPVPALCPRCSVDPRTAVVSGCPKALSVRTATELRFGDVLAEEQRRAEAPHLILPT